MSTKSWKQIRDEEVAEFESRNNLVVIDLVNIAHRVSQNIKDGKAFARKLLEDIKRFEKEYHGRKVIVLTDKGKSSYRVALFPEYKDNRRKAREKRSEAEQRAQREWFSKLKEGIRIVEETIKIFGYEGVEADDMAAVIVDQYSGTQLFDHIWLISTDGDWDLLLKDDVSRYSFYTQREYKLKDMYENSGVDTPEQLASLKALQGDRKDNIDGVEGVGTKRGYGLIREFGSALDIVEAIPLPGKQAFIRKVNESAELIERNVQLVDLVSFSAEALAHAGVYNKFVEELEEIINA
ncbi:flap endonuclease [Providencia phage vB_PreS_PR1]|uniref:Flap endonuclease n=1 Tax=Providencia phage vB_PreS_PR1 TaxID=1931407 RepID=A0A1S6KUW7_9CAUD|nr:flap endonuclease [Providencia phage vB_PreS_PR1]AQT25228.1 flap endonuclease [Providencia phage vB_PreS_PR1]